MGEGGWVEGEIDVDLWLLVSYGFWFWNGYRFFGNGSTGDKSRCPA